MQHAEHRRAQAAERASEWRGGWRVVIAALLGIGFGPGLYQNLSSLFTPGMEAAFGWSRGEIATAAGLGLVGALVAPFVGRLTDKVGTRPVIIASSAILVAGYLGLAALGANILLYQGLVLLLVLAVPGTSSLVYGKMIAARFTQHRGFALAVATSGLSLVTMVAPPALGAVIEAWGWRAGFLALALASAVVLPLILVALRGSPSGVRLVTEGEGAATLPGVSAKVARRDPRFWAVVSAALLVNFATTGLVTQMVPLGRELGLTSMHAAVLLTGFGLSAIVGRLTVGAIIDRYPPQPAGAAFALLSAGAFLLLALRPEGWGLVLALIFVAGLMNGAENDLLPFLAARLFGLRAFGEIYGSAMPIALVGSALGIIGFGRLHDLFGSYQVALFAGAAALLGAGICFLLVRDRAHPHG